jgi:hypothetical protein
MSEGVIDPAATNSQAEPVHEKTRPFWVDCCPFVGDAGKENGI